jgi:hypothetical protein
MKLENWLQKSARIGMKCKPEMPRIRTALNELIKERTKKKPLRTA